MNKFYFNLIKALPSNLRSQLEHKRVSHFLKNPKLSKIRKPGVVVSYTTIGSRIEYIEYTLGSLLSQSVLPEKVILNFDKMKKDVIPQFVLNLESEFFEINFTRDIGPHTKLIPTIQRYPDHAVVTCDDDLIYPYKWLEGLLNSAEKDLESIHAYRAKLMLFDESQASFKPYSKWVNLRKKCYGTESFLMPLGYAGVYYPPKSFFSEFDKLSLINSLCPKADDLWFKFMSLINETKSYKSLEDISKLVYVNGSQKYGLKHSNVHESGNDLQASNLYTHYKQFLNSKLCRPAK